jgi:hypothetical protein
MTYNNGLKYGHKNVRTDTIQQSHAEKEIMNNVLDQHDKVTTE